MDLRRRERDPRLPAKLKEGNSLRRDGGRRRDSDGPYPGGRPEELTGFRLQLCYQRRDVSQAKIMSQYSKRKGGSPEDSEIASPTL